MSIYCLTAPLLHCLESERNTQHRLRLLSSELLAASPLLCVCVCVCVAVIATSADLLASGVHYAAYKFLEVILVAISSVLMTDTLVVKFIIDLIKQNTIKYETEISYDYYKK